MLHRFSIILLVIFLPGCTRIFKWGKSEFNQGCPVNNDLKRNIKTIKVYNQFSTLGIFDVLLLPVDCENYLKSKTTFYILAYAPRTDLKPLNADPDNSWGWNLKLCFDGKEYHPSKLRCFNMPAIYQFYFGKQYSRFKTSYIVQFDIDVNQSSFWLEFSSLRKTAAIEF